MGTIAPSPDLSNDVLCFSFIRVATTPVSHRNVADPTGNTFSSGFKLICSSHFYRFSKSWKPYRSIGFIEVNTKTKDKWDPVATTELREILIQWKLQLFCVEERHSR